MPNRPGQSYVVKSQQNHLSAFPGAWGRVLATERAFQPRESAARDIPAACWRSKENSALLSGQESVQVHFGAGGETSAMNFRILTAESRRAPVETLGTGLAFPQVGLYHPEPAGQTF